MHQEPLLPGPSIGQTHDSRCRYAAVGLRHEVTYRQVEGASNEEQVAELSLAAPFDPLHGGPVDACRVGQLFLREAGMHAGVADA